MKDENIFREVDCKSKEERKEHQEGLMNEVIPKLKELDFTKGLLVVGNGDDFSLNVGLGSSTDIAFCVYTFLNTIKKSKNFELLSKISIAVMATLKEMTEEGDKQ